MQSRASRSGRRIAHVATTYDPERRTFGGLFAMAKPPFKAVRVPAPIEKNSVGLADALLFEKTARSVSVRRVRHRPAETGSMTRKDGHGIR